MAELVCERLKSVWKDACEGRTFAPPEHIMEHIKADPDEPCSVCGLLIIGVAEVVEPLEYEAYLAVYGEHTHDHHHGSSR